MTRSASWLGSQRQLRFIKQSDGVVTWEVRNQAGPLHTLLHGEIEFDGSLNYAIEFIATKPTDVGRHSH